ncbi:hypothetical protein [Bradyrhizobium genosp. A]|uniref:hypothetical protein n=1 Tax=Bradyrhizobium genosp. A TaxID=83626 RepID=UPI003CFB16D7
MADGTEEHWWNDSIDGFLRATIDKTLPTPTINGVKRTENTVTFPTGDGDAGTSVGVKVTYSDGTTASFGNSNDFSLYQTLQSQGKAPAPTNGATIDQAQLQQIVQPLVGQPTGPITNSWLGVTLSQFSQIGQQGFGSGGDGTALAGNNTIFSYGGVLIGAPGQGATDFASISSTEIANALYRPYFQSLQYAFSDAPAATQVFNDPDVTSSLASIPTSFREARFPHSYFLELVTLQVCRAQVCHRTAL